MRHFTGRVEGLPRTARKGRPRVAAHTAYTDEVGGSDLRGPLIQIHEYTQQDDPSLYVYLCIHTYTNKFLSIPQYIERNVPFRECPPSRPAPPPRPTVDCAARNGWTRNGRTGPPTTTCAHTDKIMTGQVYINKMQYMDSCV